MNDTYQKMSEMLDNWLSDNPKETKMALIEKEILLEKVRKLYVQISTMETEEYAAPQPEITPQPAPESKKQFTPAKTLEEDVDLFFDTEHESYKTVEEDLKNIAEEISEAQEQPEEPKPAPETKPAPEPDIFDQIEVKEKPVETEPAPLSDNAEELFIEPDFEITAQPETPVIEEKAPVVVEEPKKEEIVGNATMEEPHDEDDILQFIPPKSAPAKKEVSSPTPVSVPQPAKMEKPQPKKEQPAPQHETKQPEPAKEPLLQKPPQRSLNDLFNERREDHSISSQYQHAKVGDLTKAISINDKFIYIKELFHNRGEDFSASIRLLNECKNMEEAFDCLEQLKQKFFWDSKSDAYLSFCDLLRRKYS